MNNNNDKNDQENLKSFKKLKGRIKKFDINLYNKYDLPAREIIKQKLGDFVKDNPNIYEQDLILQDNECRYKYLELQVCVAWIYNNYPYKFPFIYERKSNFSEKTLFIILSKHMDQGLIFDKNALNEKPRRIKKYSRYFINEAYWHKVLPFYTKYLDIKLLRMY